VKSLETVVTATRNFVICFLFVVTFSELSGIKELLDYRCATVCLSAVPQAISQTYASGYGLKDIASTADVNES